MPDETLPLIAAFNAWDRVVREYAEPMDDRPLMEHVAARTKDLCTRLMDCGLSAGWAVMEEVNQHTAALLWGYFSDSTSDAPCDIEWDCHMLQAVLTPGYIVPEEVWPAYVIGTVFDGPQSVV